MFTSFSVLIYSNLNKISAKSLKALRWISENPISSTSDDTVLNWNKIGTGICYFNKTGLINDQPSQYGFLINYSHNYMSQSNETTQVDVFQIWASALPEGIKVYARYGYNGWYGTWRELTPYLIDHTHSPSDITEGVFQYTNIKAKTGTDYTTGRIRNIWATKNNLVAGSSTLASGNIAIVYE